MKAGRADCPRMIVGSKVGLRPMESHDALLLHRWFNDHRVLEDLGAEHICFCASLEEEKAFVDRTLRDDRISYYIIVEREGGRPLGLIGLANLDQRNASAELRVVLGEVGEWGKGYARDAVQVLLRHAFDVRNLHRVWLRVAEYNHRARALYARCGFREDGVLRHDHFHLGAWRDALIMSLLEHEWRSGPC